MIGLLIAASVAVSPAVFDQQARDVASLCRWQYEPRTLAEAEARRKYLIRSMRPEDYRRLDEDCQIWLLGRTEQALGSNQR
jgi:acyl-coenzyme A synthetase/AMP-(fatty) acid ligase